MNRKKRENNQIHEEPGAPPEKQPTVLFSVCVTGARGSALIKVRAVSESDAMHRALERAHSDDFADRVHHVIDCGRPERIPPHQ